MAWEFRFSGDQLEYFKPKSGFDLVGFDEGRGIGRELFLIAHFDILADAEDAMATVDMAAFISFPQPVPRPKQLDLFADPTSAKRAFHGSRGRGR